ncbi:MAG: hypothetical protein ACFB2Y_16250 [Fulvivirga sp.]|mgnify:CR=1 FL=1
MFWKRKRFLIPVLLVFLFYGLPNLINQQERAAFNRVDQLAIAQSSFANKEVRDSINRGISSFYKTSVLGEMLLGQHHRKLWSTKVNLPVFNGLDTLTFVKTGGGQQTTSVELKDRNKKRYAFRSVNKDNSNALPSFLRPSLVRPFIRDQASALNPYSGPVIAKLLKSLEIAHPEPVIYVVPYRDPIDSTIIMLAGEVVIMEEELNKRWVGSPKFDRPEQILNTNDMFMLVQKDQLEIDARLFLRCRLFDFLISDWDRHSKQWKWGVYDGVAKPIPIDRDMAFCKYEDGWASKVVRIFNNKFQSYTLNEIKVDGLTKNSLPLDKKILPNLKEEVFRQEANYLQRALKDSIIKNAFKAYPPEIYEQVGPTHIKILKKRLSELESVSGSFFNLVNGD